MAVSMEKLERRRALEELCAVVDKIGELATHLISGSPAQKKLLDTREDIMRLVISALLVMDGRGD